MKENKITKLYGSNGFLVKPILQARNIKDADLYLVFTEGKNPMYTRTHLNRVINGKRPITIELAKAIGERFGFSWTEFYEVEQSKLKRIDAVPCKEHDFRVVFKPNLRSFYCVDNIAESHIAIASENETYGTFFGNKTTAVGCYSKNKTSPTDQNIMEQIASPLLIKTTKKEYYLGFLTGFYIPVGQTEPVISLTDMHNSRLITFKQKNITHLHIADFCYFHPHWV